MIKDLQTLILLLIINLKTAELENPLVLLIESPVDTIRQIQTVLEYVIKNNKPLLIIGDLEQGVLSALAMNKIKGNIKS